MKKTPPSEGSASGFQVPPTAVLPPSESLTHLSSSSSSSMMSPSSPSSPQGVWQVHTDQSSGQQFFYHPGTKESRWSIPASPPTADMDQPEVWKQLLDQTSGRVYYYHPSTGATSWDKPLTCPPACVANRRDSSPPPLPAQDYPVDKHADDTDAVFTLPGAQLNRKEQKEPGTQQRQQEQSMMGNGVSEEGLPLQMFSAGHRRISSDITEVTSRRHSPDGLQSHLLEKAGIINKTKVADHGKKIRKNWTQSWTVLHGGVLTFHKDPKFAPAGNTNKASQIVPEYTVDLRGASVSWAPKDKSSKRNVLELKTRQGCEYLVQYDTESIISDWFKVIHDTIYQLDKGHMSEDEDESASDREDRKRPSTKSSAGTDSEQRQVRTKLRRFLQRRPTLQSVKEKGYIRDNVFGCHLDTLCHRENTTIPKFVEKCIRAVERRGLDVDGIYRVSGNLAVIQKLRHKADHEEHLDLEDGQWEEIHVITGALKLFFRELPEPLFPFSCFDKFIAAIQLPEQSQRVSYVKDLVHALPLPNYNTMELLCKHLCRVIEHKDSNRMSVQSVAIVFGPTLLWPQTESANMAVFMVFQSQIVELLLREFSTIFSEI